MKPLHLTDQLRRIIEDSGQSRYAICKATSTDQGSMSRFMARKGWLSGESLDRIGEYLGLRIVQENTQTKGR